CQVQPSFWSILPEPAASLAGFAPADFREARHLTKYGSARSSLAAVIGLCLREACARCSHWPRCSWFGPPWFDRPAPPQSRTTRGEPGKLSQSSAALEISAQLIAVNQRAAARFHIALQDPGWVFVARPNATWLEPQHAGSDSYGELVASRAKPCKYDSRTFCSSSRHGDRFAI